MQLYSSPKLQAILRCNRFYSIHAFLYVLRKACFLWSRAVSFESWLFIRNIDVHFSLINMNDGSLNPFMGIRNIKFS